MEMIILFEIKFLLIMSIGIGIIAFMSFLTVMAIKKRIDNYNEENYDIKIVNK